MIKHSYCSQGLIIVVNEHGSAELSEMPDARIAGLNNPVYYFNRIKLIPKFEGIGSGRELMEEVCKHADANKITIFNKLNPYGKRNMRQLKKFFRASGFETFSRDIMIRKPK